MTYVNLRPYTRAFPPTTDVKKISSLPSQPPTPHPLHSSNFFNQQGNSIPHLLAAVYSTISLPAPCPSPPHLFTVAFALQSVTSPSHLIFSHPRMHIILFLFFCVQYDNKNNPITFYLFQGEQAFGSEVLYRKTGVVLLYSLYLMK